MWCFFELGARGFFVVISDRECLCSTLLFESHFSLLLSGLFCALLFWFFNLIADGYSSASAYQFGEIVVECVVREPGHRERLAFFVLSRVAASEGDAEDVRCDSRQMTQPIARSKETAIMQKVVLGCQYQVLVEGGRGNRKRTSYNPSREIITWHSCFSSNNFFAIPCASLHSGKYQVGEKCHFCI